MPYVFYDKPCVFFGVPKRLPEVVIFLSEMQEKFHRMLKLFYWMRQFAFIYQLWLTVGIVIHGEGLAPIALATEDGVAKAIVYFHLAYAFGFNKGFGFGNGFFHLEAVELQFFVARINHNAVFGIKTLFSHVGAFYQGHDVEVEMLGKGIVAGNAVAMPWKAKVAGIVQGWFIGSESGEALASILTGDANPSGKLPFTWVNSLKETGAHALNTYPGTWRQEGGASTKGNIIDEEYKEGIYVGYRWTDKERIKPTFAFGHGLSYTQFAISNLRSDKIQMKQDGTITFTVNVKNTGKRAGAETVQLYIHDVKASVDRPQKELKGFQKVYLQPGESKDISITINKEALSFYDEASSSWKAEAGKFEALVGNAADNLKLKKAFELF